MAAASANQREALDIPARLAGASEVALATPAQSFIVDVRQIVPAPFALGMLAGGYFGGEFICARGAGGGGDHQKFKLAVEAGKDLVIFRGRVQLHLGLQR
jgi:hypothetical protein